MIPVIKLKDLKLVPPTKNARKRTLEIIQKCIKSDSDYKQLCKERGIPYLECIAAVAHPMAKYSR